MKETPTICASNYATTTMNLEPWWQEQIGQLSQDGYAVLQSIHPNPPTIGNIQQVMPKETIRRIVKVFIADPNENVPLERCVLYSGTEKFTDSTDTELFFEVPITELLANHNSDRVKWLDKEASKRAGKDVFLDPVKIRDLKMVVVTIAQF